MSVSTVIVQIISLNRISQGGSIIRSRRSCIIAVAGRNKKPLCVSDSQKKVFFNFFICAIKLEQALTQSHMS